MSTKGMAGLVPSAVIVSSLTNEVVAVLHCASGGDDRFRLTALFAGDLIKTVGLTRIRNNGDFEEAMEAIQEGQWEELVVWSRAQDRECRGRVFRAGPDRFFYYLNGVRVEKISVVGGLVLDEVTVGGVRFVQKTAILVGHPIVRRYYVVVSNVSPEVEFSGKIGDRVASLDEVTIYTLEQLSAHLAGRLGGHQWEFSSER